MAKKVIGDINFFEEDGDIIDRITREQLSVDRIKADTDFLKLLDYFGIKVIKSGKNKMAICPFHDDKNPSFSIFNDDKNFKCFGCDKSGDVIKFVEYYKGIKFKEALKFLNEFNGNSHVLPKKIEEHKEISDLKLDISDIEDLDINEPIETTEELIPPINSQLQSDNENQKDNGTESKPELEPMIDRQFLYQEIVKRYHETLNNKEPVLYLEKRGLKNKNNHIRFKIGFCNRSLLNSLSNEQSETLKKYGLINKDGTEFFSNCLVFPIFDGISNVVGFYGRDINDNSGFKHRYLKGKHRSVFNRKASKIYPDSLILTESIIDAMSLIELGFDNVQASYGIQGYTAEMLEIHKTDQVKEIIIAYDNDDAGRTASEKLKERLVNEGFTIRHIFPPNKKDWNEELIAGLTEDILKDLIEKAEIFTKKEEQQAFKVTNEKGVYIFNIEDLTYRIAGAKDNFVNTLKVAVDTKIMGDFFSDTVDLCSHRSRTGFSNILSERFGVEPKRIENDLLTMLKYFRVEMDKRLMPADEAIPELTESEKKLGLKFLKSPSLFEDIVNDMNALGYVGEAVNKKLMYLCATSRLMDDTLNVLVVAQSATGKSYLIETCAKLMPPEAVVDGKTFSKQALQYMGDKLMDKFFVMGEAIHDPDVDYQLRELLSSHKLIRHTVFKDEKTGEMTTREITVIAKMSSALTTTDYRINAENASRYFLINTDETDGQSKNIVEEHKNIYSEEKFYAKAESIPEIIKKHHCAQRMLKKYVVIMPAKMREAITFPVFNLRCRRDSKRFFNLIAAACFLRQYQKNVKQFKNGICYIECDAYDYEVAYGIMTEGVMSATFSELTPAVKELHRILREAVRELAEKNNVKFNEATFTQKQIRTMKNVSQTWLKTNLKILIDYEYVEVVRGGNSRTKGFYRLKDDEDLESLDLKTTLPSPETIKKAMEEDN